MPKMEGKRIKAPPPKGGGGGDKEK